jgi:hypothetical protein
MHLTYLDSSELHLLNLDLLLAMCNVHCKLDATCALPSVADVAPPAAAAPLQRLPLPPVTVAHLHCGGTVSIHRPPMLE